MSEELECVPSAIAEKGVANRKTASKSLSRNFPKDGGEAEWAPYDPKHDRVGHEKERKNV